MKNFVSLLFVLAFMGMTQSCNTAKGLPGVPGISPAAALTGIQSLLGGASSSALSTFAGGNVLSNAVMKQVLPKGLSNITNVLGSSGAAGSNALGLLNSAMGSVIPDVAGSVLGDATKGIAGADALNLLKGGGTGATDFLRNAAGSNLKAALIPAMTAKLTENGGLGAITSALGGQAGNLLGAGKPSLADLASTGAVDGLFAMMGNAEKVERANPTDPGLKDLLSKLK